MPPEATRERDDRPRTAVVYGADHSPWVQAVLLGLHLRGIETQLRALPPASVARRSGIFMPVARFEDAGEWRYDSGTLLESLGFAPATEPDRRAMQVVFGGGARARIDSPWTFFERWSRIRVDASSPLARWATHLARVVVPFYFFVLILGVRRRMPPRGEAQLLEDLGYFSGRLADGAPYLAGDVPGVADLQLFGLVQMLASIPGPSLRLVVEAPELAALRAWTGRMQAQCVGYPHLYSARLFTPQGTPPRESGGPDRVAFWAGIALSIVTLPIGLGLALVYARRVGRLGLRSARAPTPEAHG